MKTKQELLNEVKSDIKYPISPKNIGLIFDYWISNNKITQNNYLEELKNLYLENIEAEKNKDFPLDKREIRKIISFVSFTNIGENLWDELPIQKSLRVFPNIREIYLLYTKETKDNFLKIEEIFKGSKNIILHGKEINNTISDIYYYLKGLIINENMNNENTVLDLTLGMKITSIAMYKLAVERDIRVINWQDLHLPKYEKEKNEKNKFILKEGFIRIPFSSRLEIMQEPINESIRNSKSINEALGKGEYEIVANIYKNIGKEDLAFFFQKLSRLMSFESIMLMDTDYFYAKVEEFLNSILRYRKFENSTKEKMCSLVILLLTLLKFYKEDNNLLGLNLDGTEENEITLEDRVLRIFPKEKIFSEIEECFESEDLNNEEFYNIDAYERIYSYLIIKYIYKNMTSEENREDFVMKSIDKILPFCKEREIAEINNLEEINEKLFSGLNKNKNFYKILETLDIEKQFREKTERLIELKGTVLIIDKLKLSIDLAEYKALENEFSKTKKPKENLTILMMIFDSDNFKLSRDKWIEQKNISSPTYNKEKSKFKKFIGQLNDIVQTELIKNKKKSQIFVEINNKENEFSVNKYFYEYE